MRILAIDPSISSSGYCIVVNEKIIKYGKIMSNKKNFKSEDERLNYISDEFQKLIQEYSITDVVMESQFIGKNVSTGMSLKKLIGALCRTFKDIPYVSYIAPTSWRKILIRSNTNVKKEHIIKYIRENIIDIGEVKLSGVKKNDDIYEAIGIAYAYLNSKDKIIKNNLY